MRNNVVAMFSFIALCCMGCNKDIITVTYKENTVEVSPEKMDGVSVTVNGTDVKIKSILTDKTMTYVLKGDCADGRFTLKTDGDACIRLEQLSLTSQEGAPLHIKNKGVDVELCAAEGTENTIIIEACKDTAKYKSSALFSKGKLRLTGKGVLNVIANGDGCKGVNVKNDLEISDLTLNVKTTGSYLSIDTINRGGPGGMPFNPDDMPDEVKKHMDEMKARFEKMRQDVDMSQMRPGGPRGMAGPPNGMGRPDDRRPMEGLPAEGGMGMPPGKMSYNGTAKGVKSTGVLTINSGKVTVTTESAGAEGLEGKKGVVVNGGEVYVRSADDAINANDQIFFNGGDVTAISTCNDAVDSNLEGDRPPFFNDDNEEKYATEEKKSAIIINGGCVRAWSMRGAPEEGLDCDFSPIEISGGSVLSIGAGMGEMPSVPTQNTAKQPTVLVVGLNVTKNKPVELYESDKSGNVKSKPLVSFTPTFDFQNSSSILTDSSLKKGCWYVVKSGDQSKSFCMSENFVIVR